MRLMAILSGGDWADASVVFIALNDGIDINLEKIKWREWYDTKYIPVLHTTNKIPYLSFPEWLIHNGRGRSTTTEEIEEYWDM